MSAREPLYGLACGIPGQLEIVDAVCFATCGKIIVGAVNLPPLGTVMVCRTPAARCPALDREMDVPCGDIAGEPVFIRKLKRPEAKAKNAA